jgi:hypothetical protein
MFQLATDVWYFDCWFQKLEPVRLQEQLYGQFYTGDAYIVLNVRTTETFESLDNVFWSRFAPWMLVAKREFFSHGIAEQS